MSLMSVELPLVALQQRRGIAPLCRVGGPLDIALGGRYWFSKVMAAQVWVGGSYRHHGPVIYVDLLYGIHNIIRSNSPDAVSHILIVSSQLLDIIRLSSGVTIMPVIRSLWPTRLITS